MTRLAWALLLAPVAAAPARAQWVVEYLGGDAQNLNLFPLTLRQDGQPDLTIGAANYETRPLAPAPYYTARVGRWRRGRAWELELLHHKIHLQDPPPPVEYFRMTFGYNLVMANRAWALGPRTAWRVGAGLVAGQTFSKVRGLEQPKGLGLGGSGYQLTGPSAQVAVGRWWPVGRGFAIAVETKATVGYARVRIAEGTATAPNAALHLLAGLRFAR
jgi:hypothetical protein